MYRQVEVLFRPCKQRKMTVTGHSLRKLCHSLLNQQTGRSHPELTCQRKATWLGKSTALHLHVAMCIYATFVLAHWRANDKSLPHGDQQKLMKREFNHLDFVMCCNTCFFPSKPRFCKRHSAHVEIAPCTCASCHWCSILIKAYQLKTLRCGSRITWGNCSMSTSINPMIAFMPASTLHRK